MAELTSDIQRIDSAGAADGLGPDGDKGDITVGGTGTTLTVDNDAVTYAKMQNVSAASKLLGRGDSGSGDPQEITLGTNLSMSGTTLNAAGGAGTTTFSQQTVDFGSTGEVQAITTIADASILSTHEPMAAMAYKATGTRDLDELEMDQFEVKAGNIVDGVSYDIITTCLSGYAHGQYYVNVVY